MGDYNVPLIFWDSGSASRSDSFDDKLVFNIVDCFLNQIIDFFSLIVKKTVHNNRGLNARNYKVILFSYGCWMSMQTVCRISKQMLYTAKKLSALLLTCSRKAIWTFNCTQKQAFSMWYRLTQRWKLYLTFLFSRTVQPVQQVFLFCLKIQDCCWMSNIAKLVHANRAHVNLIIITIMLSQCILYRSCSVLKSQKPAEACESITLSVFKS